MRLLVLPKLYRLLKTHLHRWNGRQYFSHWSPCFGFFVCTCYSQRTHMRLEKPIAQNIAVCKNQNKQRELSDDWKSMKMLFLKEKQEDKKIEKKKDWLK